MADLTQTPTEVHVSGAGTECKVEVLAAGESITAGEPIYEATDGLWYSAIASGTQAQAAAKAIALSSAVSGGYVTAIEYGPVDVGADLEPGKHYYVSQNDGKICLESDLALTNFSTRLGYASALRMLELRPFATGVTLSGSYELDAESGLLAITFGTVTGTYSGA